MSAPLATLHPCSDPYRDVTTREYLYCDNTNFECPNGFVCKKMVYGGDRYICCSEVPSCQRGWLPFIDAATGMARTCQPSQANQACTPPGFPYKCQRSTVPSTYLCCLETTALVDSELGDAVNNNNTANNNVPNPWTVWNTAGKGDGATEPLDGGVQIEDPNGGRDPARPNNTVAATTTASTQAPAAAATTTEEWTVWG